MIQEEKSRFYKMLILFSKGSMHDRTRLLSQYPEELVDEAIQKGYIREVQTAFQLTRLLTRAKKFGNEQKPRGRYPPSGLFIT